MSGSGLITQDVLMHPQKDSGGSDRQTVRRRGDPAGIGENEATRFKLRRNGGGGGNKRKFREGEIQKWKTSK